MASPLSAVGVSVSHARWRHRDAAYHERLDSQDHDRCDRGAECPHIQQHRRLIHERKDENDMCDAAALDPLPPPAGEPMEGCG